MPLLGAHMSIAGGYYRAAEAAAALGMETVQLFTRSPSQWEAKPITPDEARQFHEAVTRHNLRLPLAHDSYLINLASPDDALYRRSVEAFVDEVHRAETLRLAYLVLHPGTATDGDIAAGIVRVARALDEVQRRCPKVRVAILLETTAGQGRTLGCRFEELAEILHRGRDPDRLGVCLDTCHVVAAGYPLAATKDYDATFAAFDRLIGLDRLRAVHLNDSVQPLGSRVDRHAAIGGGCLGLEPFRRLLNDPRFRELPMVLETPKKGPRGEDLDAVNLATLRTLLGNRRRFRLASSAPSPSQ
ncbi:MAG: deoxyribonuclease IV [Gemmataceae bacterium]|nr:deoxyribonuclease IV [Gemmataceae bacterium]